VPRRASRSVWSMSGEVYPAFAVACRDSAAATAGQAPPRAS